MCIQSHTPPLAQYESGCWKHVHGHSHTHRQWRTGTTSHVLVLTPQQCPSLPKRCMRAIRSAELICFDPDHFRSDLIHLFADVLRIPPLGPPVVSNITRLRCFLAASAASVDTAGSVCRDVQCGGALIGTVHRWCIAWLRSMRAAVHLRLCTAPSPHSSGAARRTHCILTLSADSGHRGSVDVTAVLRSVQQSSAVQCHRWLRYSLHGSVH